MIIINSYEYSLGASISIRQRKTQNELKFRWFLWILWIKISFFSCLSTVRFENNRGINLKHGTNFSTEFVGIAPMGNYDILTWQTNQPIHQTFRRYTFLSIVAYFVFSNKPACVIILSAILKSSWFKFVLGLCFQYVRMHIFLLLKTRKKLPFML